MRSTLLIAWTVLIEAIRRREVYAIVVISTLLIGAVATTRFFELQGLGKFYREIALQIMTIATNLTVIIIASRQLPREFESRTIYPLLAKPVSRLSFMLGKLIGVMAAGTFCFLLFMLVFLAGCQYLKIFVSPPLFAQFLFLQILGLLVVATLSFMLSLMTNLDAAITLGSLFYLLSSIFLSALSYLYQFSDTAVKFILRVMVFSVPQMSLFDLSEKVVHQEVWPPVPAFVIGQLTAYSLAFSSLFFLVAFLLFRRRPL
ncbi:ABC transporter permease [Candidatus Sumerlaeota bacterium]|nr:ABC transporter permease [Candidatus Sumerlaeota bacterium]